MTVSKLINIGDFLTFDYSSIFPPGTLFSYFTNPLVPLLSVVLYLLLSKPIVNFLRNYFKLKPKGIILQRVTAIHSLILAIYSGWTCYYSVPIVYNYMMRNGFWPTLCDPQQSLWTNYHFGFWITHFYLSKYYEFIDTWIVLAKGRDPIFLQTFHHAGITILMWGFIVTSNTVGLVIVCLNSFIHTLMYTYYFMAAYGYQSPLKHYLTQAQIIQFLIGMTLTIPTHFIQGCLNPAQSLVLGITQLYTIILIALFISFYLQSYKSKKYNDEGGDSTKSEKETNGMKKKL